MVPDYNWSKHHTTDVPTRQAIMGSNPPNEDCPQLRSSIDGFVLRRMKTSALAKWQNGGESFARAPPRRCASNGGLETAHLGLLRGASSKSGRRKAPNRTRSTGNPMRSQTKLGDTLASKPDKPGEAQESFVRAPPRRCVSNDGLETAHLGLLLGASSKNGRRKTPSRTRSTGNPMRSQRKLGGTTANNSDKPVLLSRDGLTQQRKRIARTTSKSSAPSNKRIPRNQRMQSAEGPSLPAAAQTKIISIAA